MTRWTPFKADPPGSDTQVYDTIAAHGVQQPLHWTGYRWYEFEADGMLTHPVYYEIVFWRWLPPAEQGAQMRTSEAV